MRPLSEILKILKNAGYLDVGLNNETFVNRIKFLPLGGILLDKIRNECHANQGDINTYVANLRNPIVIDLDDHQKNSNSNFMTENFHHNFLHVKNQFQSEIPLAIKEEARYETKTPADSNKLVDLKTGTLLSCSYFVNESAATEYFHKIQRERKIWWMRLSLNPGRYFLSNLSAQELNGQKAQIIKIKSKFDFGEMELETVTVTPLRAITLNNLDDFRLKDIRLQKDVLPAVIRSELCLETAVLGLLLDSVEDTRNEKISINRKIAPYQCSIFCFSQELEDLAAHLTNVIRKSGLAVWNLQKFGANSKDLLEAELSGMDRIGIPYSIILEPDTLQTGLMKFRSRDTELSEIIHITDVPDYLMKIFNS